MQLFKKEGFNLRKWNSNVPELESENNDQNELTYIKQILNQGSNEIKILGLGWNKQNDTLSVVTPTFKKKQVTNVIFREFLLDLNTISDIFFVYFLSLYAYIIVFCY